MSKDDAEYAAFVESVAEEAAERYWNTAAALYAKVGIPTANMPWALISDDVKRVERFAVLAAVNVAVERICEIRRDCSPDAGV